MNTNPPKLRGKFFFGYDKPNRYSWSILFGCLESQSDLIEHICFTPLPFHIYEIENNQEEWDRILSDDPLDAYDFVIFAFSLMSIQMDRFRAFAESGWNNLKALNSDANTIFIAGGPHPTVKSDEVLELGMDYIFRGEAELSLSQFLFHFVNNSRNEIDTPEFHQSYNIYSPHFQPSSLNSSQLIEIGQYPPFSEKFRLFGPIEISRGCPFQCKFCQTGSQSPRMRHASVENVLKWVKRAVEIKYDKLWFLTPNAFAFGSKNGVTPNLDTLSALFIGLQNISGLKGIYFGTFPGEVRPESVTREVLELVTPIITNHKILIGAQTASNNLLRKIQRGHTWENVETSIQLLTEFGFKVELDFIFGLPGETEDDILETLRFFKQIDAGKYPKIKIHTHTFMPLPGTPYENEPHGAIDERIFHITGKLAQKGKAYGEHINQAKLVKTRYSKKE